MDPNDQRKLLRAILRSNLESFIAKSFHHVSPAQELVRGWYLSAIAYQLERCRKGEIKRLIITMPPRYLKSICASVAFPAFLMGHDPASRIICVSYSAELSAKHARDCRAIMTSSWFNELFPACKLSRERNAELDYMTTRRGFRLSTSVGGTLTGRGGQFVIVDDPMKPDEAMSEVRRASVANWFDNTLYSRLDSKKDHCMIVIMQRLHLDDIVGHITAKEEGWVHLDLPAIAEIEEDIPIGPGIFHRRRIGEVLDPVREPLEVLEALKRSMGSFNFSAQYQQRPVPVDGEIFKWEWFRLGPDLPAQRHNIIQSWDTASKGGELNDHSVCTTWLRNGLDFYLLNVFRKRLLYPELKRAVIDLCQKWNARAVLIEDAASGTALIQELQRGELRQAGRPIAIKSEGDKVVRAAAQSMCIEAGRVFLPRFSDWLADFKLEVLQFPNGRYDDQVDSMTQFLAWANQRQPGVYKIRVTGI